MNNASTHTGEHGRKRLFLLAALGLALAFILLLGIARLMTPPTDPGDGPDTVSLRWATSAVGSAGHRAKVSLATVLNREWTGYHISVMPTAGAVATLRGYALGQYDGYYGADIAFRELAEDGGRFRDFRRRMDREPVQSFWVYTMEVGVAIRAADKDRIRRWRDLDGRPVFTGPAPWDVRAQLERAFTTLGINHRYRELDLGLAGSALAEGTIDAFIVYTAGASSLAPWVAEAEMGVDLVILNPDDEEIHALRADGMDVIPIPATVFQSDPGVETAHFVPFYYGFHVGLEVPAEDVYRKLLIVEAHANELAAVDRVFAQMADDLPGLQRRAIAATGGRTPVHPGLARFLQERDAWDPAWDTWIAR